MPTPLAVALHYLLPSAIPASLAPWPSFDLAGSVTLLPVEGAVAPGTLPVAELLLALYLLGMVTSAVPWLAGLVSLHNIVRYARPAGGDGICGRKARAEVARLQALGIEVSIVDAAVSPFALRWPKPRVVFPAALLGRLDDAQLALVLRHEGAHLARHDAHWELLMRIGGLLLWFNPFLRPIRRRVQLAAELACDAVALAAEKNMRRAYAQAYLETLRMSMVRTLPCPAIAFSLHKTGSHRMRIEHIVGGDPRGRKRPLAGAAALVMALGAGCCLTVVQASPPASIEVEFAGPIIDGRISSHFGKVRANVSAQPHRGIDLTAPRGTPVRAPAAGVVTVADEVFASAPNYGTVIVLDHGDGWQTLYAHLDSMDVAVGDRVAHGQAIGGLGTSGKATGPHVHVEVLKDGVRMDPMTVIGMPVAAR